MTVLLGGAALLLHRLDLVDPLLGRLAGLVAELRTPVEPPPVTPPAPERPASAAAAQPRPEAPERQGPERERPLTAEERSAFAGLDRDRRPLAPLPGIYADAMSAATDAAGAVWVLTKYDITRFRPGERGADTLLDARGYQRLFGAPVQALSTLAVIGPDEAVAGGWYGQLLRWRGGEWRRLAGLEGRVREIVALGGRLYAAGDRGLWSWTEAEGAVRVTGVSGAVAALASDGTRLYAAQGERIRVLANGLWSSLPPLPQGLGDIETLTFAGSTLLVGSRHGVAARCPEGWRHEAAEGPVYALHPEGERLWVASWSRGLGLRDRLGWHYAGKAEGLPSSQATAVTTDRRGRIWLNLYGTGLLVLERERAHAQVLLGEGAEAVAGPFWLCPREG